MDDLVTKEVLQLIGGGIVAILIIDRVNQLYKTFRDKNGNGNGASKVEMALHTHAKEEMEIFTKITNNLTLMQENLVRLNASIDACARDSRDANARLLQSMAIILDREERERRH